MSEWKSSTGVSDETGRVVIYCPEDEIEQWTEETDRLGYSSRSLYLYELIHEARKYRQQGFLSHESDNPDNGRHQGEPIPAGRPDLVKQHLSIAFHDLDEIVDEIIESHHTESLVRPIVENGLYELAEQGSVEYRRGHGWRLIEQGDR